MNGQSICNLKSKLSDFLKGFNSYEKANVDASFDFIFQRRNYVY
jgi:hypothetical protein